MDPDTPPESPTLRSESEKSGVNDIARIPEARALPVAQINSLHNAVSSIAKSDASEPNRAHEHALNPEKQLVLPKSLLHSYNLGRVIKLLQSGNGLDKSIRTIQYTTRLVAHIMLVKGLHTPSSSTAAQAIRRQFGLTRKLLRSFNNIGQFNATLKLLLNAPERIKNDAVGYTLELIRGLGFTGFGIMDTLGYLPDAGIATIPYKNVVDKLAFHFWLYALAAGILGGMLNVYRLRARIAKYRSIFPTVSTIEGGKEEVKKASQELQVRRELPPTPPESPIPTNQVSVDEAASTIVKELEMQNYDISLNVIGDSADILFPLAALKVSGFDLLSDGVMGFAGCISSAVGFRKAWRATA